MKKKTKIKYDEKLAYEQYVTANMNVDNIRIEHEVDLTRIGRRFLIVRTKGGASLGCEGSGTYLHASNITELRDILNLLKEACNEIKLEGECISQ